MYYAAKRGSAAVVQLLLDVRANKEAADQVGGPPAKPASATACGVADAIHGLALLHQQSEHPAKR